MTPLLAHSYAAGRGSAAEYLSVGSCLRYDLQWASMTCAFAARSGYLDIPQLDRANDCPWDDHTCVYTAGRGKQARNKVVTLRDCNGPEPMVSHGTRGSAAIGGHLEMIKWARANCRPWDEETCFSNGGPAAAGGLAGPILQWARARQWLAMR